MRVTNAIANDMEKLDAMLREFETFTAERYHGHAFAVGYFHSMLTTAAWQSDTARTEMLRTIAAYMAKHKKQGATNA